jgi:hypothetical protein
MISVEGLIFCRLGPHCPLVERNLLTSASFLDFIKVLEIPEGDSSDPDGFDTLKE